MSEFYFFFKVQECRKNSQRCQKELNSEGICQGKNQGTQIILKKSRVKENANIKIKFKNVDWDFPETNESAKNVRRHSIEAKTLSGQIY